MELTLPNIEELSGKVRHIVNVDQDGDAFLEMYRLQTQALLLVCLELVQINNNLEALRDTSGVNVLATLKAHGEEIAILRGKR